MIFAPGSVTCIFAPQISEDARRSGSIGVGFTVELGVIAEKSDRLIVNGEEREFPTVEYVLSKIGIAGVEIRTQLPFGCGFGMSGASAIAAAMLGEAAFMQLADIAHEAEVVNLTGLGDVVTQTFGGVVVRKSASCPSLASIERFHFSTSLDFLILGELPTREVLAENRSKIAEEGKFWTKEFLRRPTLDNLFACSLSFAKRTGLLEFVEDVVEAVESSGGKASMVMLGKAVFALNGFEALKEFGDPFRARIDCCGVRRVEGSRDPMQDRRSQER